MTQTAQSTQPAADTTISADTVASPSTRLRRRALLRAGTVSLGALAAPALLRAQPDAIRIGHLTPLTGFLGPLGEYGVMGIKLAAEQINAAGGVMGRKIELLSEDSVNPSQAAAKAQRLLERDKVAVLIGEISSASGLAISQVAGRMQRIFVNTGCNSDELRGKSCNKFMFHVEAANTMYVNAAGQALLKANLIKGKKLFALTADYSFGHDLLRAAKVFVSANGGQFVGDELVPTDATDFSAYMLKIRQTRPDVVVSNLSGNQITNFIKQYAEFGLPYPTAGFTIDTASAWGAGGDNFGGIWPLIWHHTIATPGTKAFVDAFVKANGKPPENQAWGDFIALKVIAQAMAETKSTDSMKMVEYLEKGAEFDLLKTRKGSFRAWDHQLMQEMYSVSPNKSPKDKWDIMTLGTAVPAAGQPLEVLAPTREQNACTF